MIEVHGFIPELGSGEKQRFVERDGVFAQYYGVMNPYYFLGFPMFGCNSIKPIDVICAWVCHSRMGEVVVWRLQFERAGEKKGRDPS